MRTRTTASCALFFAVALAVRFVEPTIRGIEAGVDEVLERALELIGQRN